MPRIRALKHGYFTNEELAQKSSDARLLGLGLTTLADREGRLEDRPRRIRAEIFPYHPDIDCDALLNELKDAQFIIRYTVENKAYIQIRHFLLHQQPHFKEAVSKIPPPPDFSTTPVENSVNAVMGNGNGSTGNGSRVMGNGKAAPRQPPPRRIQPEIDPPFSSEEFLQSIGTYLAVRQAAKRPLQAESLILLYNNLREWGEADSIIALNGAAMAGHFQVLHPDKYRNGNGTRFRAPITHVVEHHSNLRRGKNE